MRTRIGFGYDVHQLKKGIPFRLGGVDIAHTKGALGHSDADVLIHAICDAILGAAALGDIGKHFPDNSSAYKGINSLLLLKKTIQLLSDTGYQISNIDSTICLQKPKIQDYIGDMRATLSSAMEIDIDQVSVKATTEEKMGITGTEEGVSAYAVVLIWK
ncbi:MAG: 2-C-methyl-D-erythritol 2,4-cyclodiphosphate synthase [Bacteroidales bacterium]|jgi:2-C-methyl-D-erythritol 2,4-cyclodiphosphate synthase|nr:2-C-methyl-D-erythritol 2,4-cyclodiphosphate synthase [Bacteroidales bacterium]